MIIPESVIFLGVRAFGYCTALKGLYFEGSARDLGVFYNLTNATVYYLPGTAGWVSTFGGLPTALWLLPYPLILNNGPGFGVRTNEFGFIISWATNTSVVVEVRTALGNPGWSPLATNQLADGWSYFSDPHWTNHPARFYRLRSP